VLIFVMLFSPEGVLRLDLRGAVSTALARLRRPGTGEGAQG
jgi:hypothetical protein